MPLFEWQISDIATDLPPEFQVNPLWITTRHDSLESDSYVLKQVERGANGCRPTQLSYEINRSPSDERLEHVALNVGEKIDQWLTGLYFTGEITMAVLLALCGIYIWWFTIGYNRPIAEAFSSTIVAALLVAFLMSGWRLWGPLIGGLVCSPEIHGTLSVDAKLSKVHYETLFVLFLGICAEVGALGMIFWLIIKSAIKAKGASSPAVG